MDPPIENPERTIVAKIARVAVAILLLAIVVRFALGVRSEIREARSATRQLAIELEARSRESEKQLEEIRARRRTVPRVPEGTTEQLREIARLNQILVDEMLVLLEHTAATQTILARTLAGSG